MLNLTRARFGGPAWLVLPGPRPPVQPRPGPAAGGGRGRIYQAIRRLYRAHKTPSGAAGGRSRPPAWRSLARRFSIAVSVRPATAPPRQPLRRSGSGSGAGAVSGAGRLRLWSSVAGRRRGPAPSCCRSGSPAGSVPCPARSSCRAGPVRRGSLRSAGPGPALARSWPLVRRGPPVPLPVQSGAAIFGSNRDFSAPYTGPKISSDFPGEVFYARGLSLDSWYINAPL